MGDYDAEFKKIRALLKGNPKGKTIFEVSNAIGTSRNSTAKYLDIMLAMGILKRRTIGRAKVHTLA